MVLKHEDVTGRILGAAFEAHKHLGFGFLEKVYENSLALELRRRGSTVEQQKPVSVRYQGAAVGEYVCDLLVDGKALVEVKAVARLVEAHHAQLICYLRATGIEVGLLLNFGHSVEYSRKILDAPHGCAT